MSASQLAKRGHGIFVAILFHEPSWRLLEEKDASNQDKTWNILEC
jgi:hypothetical protein